MKKNYGVNPPINGISELLAIEPRSLPHGAARICQLANQCPTWFTFLLKSVTTYQDLELDHPIQGAWVSQNNSTVVSAIQTESGTENTFAKAILTTPDRNIHQYKSDSWRILFGSSIVESTDPTGVVVSDFVGQIYIDSVSSSIYISNGLSDTHWTLAGNGGGSS